METSARFAAMANAGLAWNGGAENIYSNPAGIFLPTHTFDLNLFYARPFGLPDVRLGNVALCYSFPKIAVGAAAQNYGNSIYQENQFLAAAAWQAFDKLKVGAAARYGLLSIQNYGSAGALLLDFGMTYHLRDDVVWGFVARNLNNAKIGACDEPLPVSLATGLSLQPAAKIRLNFDVCQDARFPLDARCGVEYAPFSRLAVRLGVGNQPARFCAGFSLAIFRARLDYAFSSHADLGGTHMFSLGLYK